MTVRPTRTRRSLPALFVAGAALAALAACGGDDGGDGGSSGEFSVANALADLPEAALEDNYVLTAADLDRATELAGATRPPAGTDDKDEVFDWVLELEGVRREEGEDWPPVAVLLPEASNPSMLAGIAEFRDEVGWTLLDVSSYAEVSTPPARFTVLHGEFDVDDIDAAIDDKDGDIWSIGGEDFSVDVTSRSPARNLGEALRLAEQDGALAVSKSTPPVEAWLEGGDRLDDDDDLVAVAEALDEHDVYAVMILDGDALTFAPPLGRELTPEQLEELIDQQLLPFEVLGAGLTVVDDEAVGVLAYEHATTDVAEENAAMLEELFADASSSVSNEPLSSMFTDVDVAVDGTTVTVTFGFDDETSTSAVWRALQVRELFASHG